jgi:hypothetical protein
MITIYALLEPDSDEVRYVGRTANHPWQRYSQHLMGVDRATKLWVRALRPRHKVPAMKILEEEVSSEVAGIRERHWIAYYRGQGAHLLNYHHNPRPQPPLLLGRPGVPGTLRSVCQAHAIHTIRELTRRTGLSRQVGWNLWHGYTGIGRKLFPILHDGLGIPYEELLRVEPIPHSQRPRRGKRPRKPPPEETTPL